jgi:hypothetical protein
MGLEKMGLAMKFVSIFMIGLIIAASSAQAASCSAPAMRKLFYQVRVLENSMPACDRVMNASSNNIALMCRVCRVPILQLLAAERVARRNPGCFEGYEGRQALNNITQAKGPLNFLRRGCGF